VNRLQAKITTADVGWAGTDDDVTLTLAGRAWNLDNPWHDDFERGNTDGFDLDPGSGLHLSAPSDDLQLRFGGKPLPECNTGMVRAGDVNWLLRSETIGLAAGKAVSGEARGLS
jgi:hypothetical protein